MEGSKVALERRGVNSFASKLREGGDRKVRRFLEGKGRGWRRKSKGSRRRIEGRKGRGKWEREGRKGIGQQFRSEGLFRVITSNTCKKIRTFVEFPRSVTP